MSGALQQEAVYAAYCEKVRRYISGKLTDQVEAEDLTSEVFLKIYEKIDTFDSSLASVSTWVYTIARNTVIDYFRTKKTFAEVPEALTAAETIEDRLMQKDKLQALCGALKTLDQRSRDLILLRYYRGMTLKDIAQHFSISYAYVKRLHSTALADLRQQMEKENGIMAIKGYGK